MQRSQWVAVLFAGGVLVGGCSSGSGTTTSSTAAATSAAASSEMAETSAAESGSVASAALDAQSIGWFDALCTGIGPTMQDLGALGQDSTADPAQAQADVVAKVEAASAAFGATADTLASTPPPTFTGGSELAAAITTDLQSAATELPQSAATYAAISSSDAAALAAGEQTLASDMTSALASLQGISQLEPDLQAAVAAIPTCKAMGG